MTAIEVGDLRVFFGDNCLLGPVSFRVPAGERLVIMGETGAGKSLIAQAILGCLPHALRMEGRIALNGERVDSLPENARQHLWGRTLTSLPQEPWNALDPLMASWRQVAETYRYVSELTPGEAQSASLQRLSNLGLRGAESKLPGQLSGGMAQRVAFAAATAGPAPILLADEPTKGLDSHRETQIVRLLSQVPENGGTLLLITHEASVAGAIGGHLVVMRHGQVVEEGNSRSVLNSPQSEYTRALLAADPRAWERIPAGRPGDTLLTAKNLAVTRGRMHLIEGFDLTLRAGERVCILGPSGIGKTSLLDALAGIVRPAAGSIIRSEALGTLAVQKLYQDPPAAFPAYISLGRSLGDVAKRHRVPWDKVLDYLEMLSLRQDLLLRVPKDVSGGELQRLSIARALTANPKVLLADEPTSRLDPITQQETLELLAEISAARSIACLLVTHNPNIANKWADRTIDLSRFSPREVDQNQSGAGIGFMH